VANQKPASSDRSVVLGDLRGDYYRLRPGAVDMTRPALPMQQAEIAAQPENIVVDLRKCALIVIDMQNDFCSRAGWLGSLGVDLTGIRQTFDPINAALTAARARSIPIIWVNWGVRADRANLPAGVQYPFNRVGCGVGLGDRFASTAADRPDAESRVLRKDSWGAAVVPELAARPDDIYVDKHRISGFWDTPLDSILRALQVKTLFFAGINADHCVLATLMDASFHGYDTLLLEDCTATCSPDFCLKATLHNVRFCFGFTVRHGDFVTAAQLAE
jgi:ureidoacrylate peracid hydrolase